MTPKMFEFGKLDNGWELEKYNYYDNPDITCVEIPEEYKCHKVKSIGSKAFSSASFLERIVIPDSVTNIGSAAFEYCERLAEITLPKNLKIIDYNVFKLCTALESITLPVKTAVIRPLAFQKCTALKTIKLTGMMCVIYNNAFEDCSELRSVVFPESPDSPDSSCSPHSRAAFFGKAFCGCTSLDTRTAMYSLIGENDLNQPFAPEPNWDIALREDVFSLAIGLGSFSEVNKLELFKQIIDRGLIDYMPQAEYLLNESAAAQLVQYAAERGKTEFTARLLNYKRQENKSENDIAEIIDSRYSL